MIFFSVIATIALLNTCGKTVGFCIVQEIIFDGVATPARAGYYVYYCVLL